MWCITIGVLQSRIVKTTVLTIKKKLLKLREENVPQKLPAHRSSHRRCSTKKLFLKISQNSQENNCVRVSFLIIKLEA